MKSLAATNRFLHSVQCVKTHGAVVRSYATAAPAQPKQQEKPDQNYVNPSAPNRLSFMTLARRTRIRRRLVSKNDPNEDPDANVIITPRERIGRDYDLNFKLHRYNIAPSNEAFHNLHLEGLLHQTTGTLDKNKALHLHFEGEDDFTVYYGERAPGSVKDANTLSIDQYKGLMKEMKEHICHEVDQLFVHDGAVGANASSDVRLRAVCDNPETALYLHHVVPRVYSKKATYKEPRVLPDGQKEDYMNKYTFEHSITVYVAAKYQPKDANKFGLKGKSSVVVDVARGIAIVVGTSSTEALRTAISAVAAPRLLADKNLVALPADLLAFGDKHLLVVSPGNLLPKKGLAGKVVGGHGLTWSANGVFSLFNGHTHTADGDALARGSLVEHYGKTTRVTAKNPANNYLHSNPSNVVILVSDDSKTLPPLSKVTNKASVAPLISGFLKSTDGRAQHHLSSAIPHTYNTELASLATAFKGDLYVINVAAKDRNLSDQEVADLLKAIAEGKASSAPSSSGIFSTLSPITSIAGVSAVLDPAKRGYNASSYKADATKWEESVNKYVESLTPKVEESKEPGKEPPKPPAWAKYLTV